MATSNNASRFASCKTTGEILHKAVCIDEMVTDEQTLKDFGFENCVIPSDQFNLLGVYRSLIVSLAVSSKKLDEWKEQGLPVVGENLLSRFKRRRATVPGEYYEWAFSNQYIWGLKSKFDEWVEKSNRYAMWLNGEISDEEFEEEARAKKSTASKQKKQAATSKKDDRASEDNGQDAETDAKKSTPSDKKTGKGGVAKKKKKPIPFDKWKYETVNLPSQSKKREREESPANNVPEPSSKKAKVTGEPSPEAKKA
ncbi:hypothetical protein CKAH01_11759 [Colletotrichum kahawae]|uniref:Uncharacterized protein n=1 Tax=Colletotrichum kahawae TaxID=34407 RepID=A0AAD9YVG7_COLKA|nr:hypothetical protein CKAH01_11759 [Colletotrichum kahawae]